MGFRRTKERRKRGGPWRLEGQDSSRCHRLRLPLGNPSEQRQRGRGGEREGFRKQSERGWLDHSQLLCVINGVRLLSGFGSRESHPNRGLDLILDSGVTMYTYFCIDIQKMIIKYGSLQEQKFTEDVYKKARSWRSVCSGV
ncbi:hypothetical protein DVH24_003774 [Malus domestica]|uniref:Uncharacterized protein n=1 Tax=Malus domestica TaxID=3750 RepID=A0A498KCC1_MALDO|nr:hypothetical protein DVH24_003774 [Malus domestica]